MSTVLQLKKKKACCRFDAACGRNGLGQLQGASPLNWGAGAQLLPHAVTWHFHPHCEPSKSGTKRLAPPPLHPSTWAKEHRWAIPLGDTQAVQVPTLVQIT